MDCDNVTKLEATDTSPADLGNSLREAFDAGEVADAVVLTRDSEGYLEVQYNPMEAGELAELAFYLVSHVLNMIWQDNQAPVPVDEGESG